MKRIGFKFIASLVFVVIGWVSPALATPITYTQVATASGTIGGTPFTNALEPSR
jgi:hypothetical protein